MINLLLYQATTKTSIEVQEVLHRFTFENSFGFITGHNFVGRSVNIYGT